MTKQIKSFLSLLLCVLLTAALFAPYASADQAEHAARQPDYDQPGSITVDILLGDGTPVPGGSLTAYLVAEARYDDGNNDFVYAAPFGDGVVDAEAINNAEAGAPKLAAALAEKIGGAQPVGKAEVNASGRAVFSDLKLGLYLIVQDTPAPGYEPVRSFLVTVPTWDGEKLVYDVTANPKPSISYKKATYDPPVEKVVTVSQGAKADASEIFTFRLTPASKDQPMPVNATASADPGTGALLISRAGAGKVEFGTIYYGMDDVGKTYTYTVEEIPGTNKQYTYETRKYTMTVVVTMQDGVITATPSCLCSDNSVVTNMQFVNKLTVTPSGPSGGPGLPQAGQRWWPVSVLAGLGVVFFLLGWTMNRKKARS